MMACFPAFSRLIRASHDDWPTALANAELRPRIRHRSFALSNILLPLIFYQRKCSFQNLFGVSVVLPKHNSAPRNVDTQASESIASSEDPLRGIPDQEEAIREMTHK